MCAVACTEQDQVETTQSNEVNPLKEFEAKVNAIGVHYSKGKPHTYHPNSTETDAMLD